MAKLPRQLPGRECIQALERAGFHVHHQRGSHVVLKRDNPTARVVVPAHKTLAAGTLRSIIRQAGLTVDEFVSLL